jgi:hypothetical protein
LGVEAILFTPTPGATPAILDDTTPLFSFPAVGRKKLTAAFDGGRITSDGGVLLLGVVERQLGIAETLAALIDDPRNPLFVTHAVSDILRARILAIACGYEDGDDLDVLRSDPAFKLACGRLPDSGGDLCSQPTVSRWENMPTLREVIRMIYAMIDVYCDSYLAPPAEVTLDIDATCDVAHRNQQLALFHAHYDERCFLPIHVYDAVNPRPVVVLSARARRRAGWRSVPMCGAWCAVSAHTGRTRASSCATTVTTVATRS